MEVKGQKGSGGREEEGVIKKLNQLPENAIVKPITWYAN